MHGQFVWYELHTPDVDAAIKFYPRFTGWGTQSFDKDYTMWTTGGVPFAGIFRLNDRCEPTAFRRTGCRTSRSTTSMRLPTRRSR